jgi:hypothetical protein
MLARTFAVAALLAFGAAAPSVAQTPNTSIVPGFEKQIRFGITREQVNTFWRETPTHERRQGPVLVMDYVPWQGMNWTVNVHDQLGLIGIVATSLPTNPANTCQRIFDALVRGMNDELRVQPTGQTTVARGQNVCTTVRAGQGEAGHHWRTAEGVGVSVWVDPRDGLVHYVLGTDAFLQWAGGERAPLAYAAKVEPPAGAQTAAAPAPPAPAPAPSAAPSSPAPSAAADVDEAAPKSSGGRNLGVTAAAFKAIRPGMTLQQVEAIIGRAGTRSEAVPGVQSVTYRWTNQSPFRIIVVSFLNDGAMSSTEVSLYPTTGGPRITMEQYRRLSAGMTFREVVAALGGEGDYIGLTNFMDRVSYQYRWRGRAPGSFVIASFVNGRLSSVPTQFGLQ